MYQDPACILRTLCFRNTDWGQVHLQGDVRKSVYPQMGNRFTHSEKSPVALSGSVRASGSANANGSATEWQWQCQWQWQWQCQCQWYLVHALELDVYMS